MAADHGAQKRPREETSEIDSLEEENKKLRCEDDELYDVVEGPDPNPIISDLDSVVKSLEDEISVDGGSGCGSGLAAQQEFGYLLEASDDELGLPPSMVGEFYGSGENRGFEEETEFIRFVDGGGEEYLSLDGLFDYTDAGFGSTEFLWRSESMSAQ